MTGLVVGGTGFEVLVGEQRVGARRVLDRVDVDFLEGLTARYVRAVRARSLLMSVRLIEAFFRESFA